jgi:hypothetical protein
MFGRAKCFFNRLTTSARPSVHLRSYGRIENFSNLEFPFVRSLSVHSASVTTGKCLRSGHLPHTLRMSKRPLTRDSPTELLLLLSAGERGSLLQLFFLSLLFSAGTALSLSLPSCSSHSLSLSLVCGQWSARVYS